CAASGPAQSPRRPRRPCVRLRRRSKSETPSPAQGAPFAGSGATRQPHPPVCDGPDPSAPPPIPALLMLAVPPPIPVLVLLALLLLLLLLLLALLLLALLLLALLVLLLLEELDELPLAQTPLWQTPPGHGVPSGFAGWEHWPLCGSHR